MVAQRIAWEGLIAGMIGAAAVALWFLVVDTIAGQPMFTPAMLGGAVFDGLRDPAAVDIELRTVVLYTTIHLVAFSVIGMAAASLAAVTERFPSTVFLAAVFFVFFEVAFYVIVAVAAQPLLGALAWTNVAIGNAIAALGMGWFLWKAHPRVRSYLEQHPLGETADGV